MTSLRTFAQRASSWFLKLHGTDHLPVISTAFQFHANSVHLTKQPGHISSKSQFLGPAQCQFCCKQHWSGANAKSIPQIDLAQETEEGKVLVNQPDDPGVILSNLSEEDTRRLKIIKLEFDVIEQMSGMVPETMADSNWLHALQLDSKSKRMSYYRFLRKNELKEKARKKKQQLKQQQRQQEAADKMTEEAEDKPTKNTIFLMVYDSAMKRAGEYRLAHAMQFGQPLVFDMDYELFMRHQDCQNLVSQILMAYGKNRDAKDPFHLIFTSLNPAGKVYSMLHRAKLTGQHFMGTMTECSYLDLFPRKQLVYLSPHANQELGDVEDDSIYIVGGFNDKSWQKPVSLARAKEQGLRTAKFPLDKFLLWGCGSKSLTIDQVMAILLEQRRKKNWQEAFKVIPQRKLYRDN